MNDLSLCVTQILDGEGDGPLHTVQIVVDTQSFQDEQGGCDTTQTKLCGEVLLKEVFNKFDALLGLLRIEQGLIVQGFDYLSHFTVDSNFGCKDNK